MTIDIEVTNNDCKILNKLTLDQLVVIQNECKFKVDDGEYIKNNYRRRGYQWDGYRKLFNIQTRRFPIGLLDRVKNLLTNNGYAYNIIIKRDIIDSSTDYGDAYGFDKREYQKNAVLVSLVNGNGILKIATGGGKTAIAGFTIQQLKKKTIFIVHTRDLLYQAKDVFSTMFPYEHIGQIGDGVIEYGNITVATMQTLAILGGLNKDKNYETKSKFDEDGDASELQLTEEQIKMAQFHNYAMTVQCVMMDEVQIVSSQMAFGVRFLFERANYAFGYSASPWRDDGSDLMIEAAFGRRIVDITASELIKLGYLVKPTIEIHNTVYDTRDCPKKYVDIYKKFIVENDERNLQVVNDAVREWKNGMNTLILVTQIKHGNALESIFSSIGIDATFISGKSGMKKRKQAIQDMRDGKVSLMIASTIADVGLDIPRLQCIVEAGAGKSSVTALQRLGRIMRPFEGKTECKFISYRDGAKYIKNHIELKKNIWQTEPEFIIIDNNSIWS